MPQIRTRTAILLAGAGLVLLLASLSFLVIFEPNRASMSGRLQASSASLSRSVLEAESSLYHFLGSAREADLAAHGRALEEAERFMLELSAADASLGVPGSLLTESLAELEAKIESWRLDYAVPATEAKLQKEPGKLAGLTRRGVGPARFGQVGEALRAVEEHVSQTCALDRARRSRARAAAAAGALLGTGLLGGAALVLVLRQRRILAESGRQDAHLKRLAEFSEMIHHANSSGQAARQLAQALSQGREDSLVLLGAAGKTGLAVAAYGSGVGEARELLPLLEDRESCPVLRTGQPLFVADAGREHVCDCPLRIPDSSGSFCLPVLARAAVAGVAGLRFPVSAPPGTKRLEEVRALVRITSLAVNALTARDEARTEALTDALTGTFNRRFLETYLEKQMQSASRRARPLAVLMLDLDRFKAFNDKFGHQAGDDLLRACAAVMTDCLREGDLAARFGGEEFTIVLPDADRDTAYAIGERIRSRVETLPAASTGGFPGPTVSIGLAVSPQNGATADALIGAADDALYQAKESGRNRVIAAA